MVPPLIYSFASAAALSLIHTAPGAVEHCSVSSSPMFSTVPPEIVTSPSPLPDIVSLPYAVKVPSLIVTPSLAIIVPGSEV